MDLNRVLSDLLALRKKVDRILLEPYIQPRGAPASRTKTSYRNIVTKYDQNAEKEIVETLTALYPDVTVVAEESRPAERMKSSGWMWCIDPLDGTVNYAYGHPLFAVSIALLHDQEPAVGMVHVPYIRETFWAIRGKGAYLNGRRVFVGRTEKLSHSLLSTGFPYTRNQAFRENLRGMNKLLPGVRDFRRCGSASIDLASVACGRLDGYFEAGLSTWDVAAGGLLVTEAGGKVTDWHGGPEWMRRRRVLAANPRLHRALLRALGKSTAGRSGSNS